LGEAGGLVNESVNAKTNKTSEEMKMKTIAKETKTVKTAYRIVVCLGVLSICSVAWAAEGGSGLYLLGTMGPQTGLLPESGTYLTNYSYYYTAKAGRATEGGFLRADLKVDVFANFTNVTHVTEQSLLGGQYGFGAFIPLVCAKYNADIGIGGSTFNFKDSDFGLGDIILSPLLLGWHQGNSHFLAIGNLYLPTGKYDTGTGVNLGKNRYAIEPAFGYTYLNEENGHEFSTGLGYTINFKNTDTDYRTGDEFHADFLLGQHLPNGVMVGAVAYWYQQVTADSGGGAVLGDNKGRVWGAGPVLSYSTKLNDNLLSLNFKYYCEFEAKNRLEGDALFFQVTYQF
jgi:hypothetical protein